jgi:hypothetical protein
MPSPDRGTAVLIHGCHTDAYIFGRNWSGLVWGNNDPEGPPSLFGRAVMGIKVALEQNTKLLIFGAGVDAGNGLSEAQYVREFLVARADKLAGFYRQQWGIPVSKKVIEHRLGNVTLNLISRNTTEECLEAVSLCMERNISWLTGVTNAFHAPRALRELNAAHAEIFQTSSERDTMRPPLSVAGASAWGTPEENRSTKIRERAHRPKAANPAARGADPNAAPAPA